MTQTIESEVELRIRLLRNHPIMKQNKWGLTTTLQWLDNRTRIVMLTVTRGKNFSEVFTVTRDENEVKDPVATVFEYATRRLGEIEVEKKKLAEEMA